MGVFLLGETAHTTIIFLECGGWGGAGMKNIEKNCLQDPKRQNKLPENMICVDKLVCISEKKCLQSRIN